MSRVPRLKQFEFHREKLAELILYISEQCADDPAYGAVKLNKILYYADFDAYRLLGAPITGAQYRKLSEGPVPRDLVEVRMELEDAGRLRLEERRWFNRMQKRPVVVGGQGANVELFSREELSAVQDVIAFFFGKSAREVSDYSHREPGWILAEDREDIPYETAWLDGDPIDQETEESAVRVGMELLKARR